MRRLERSATLLRNFIFGVEDSLVSTVGLLSGIALAGVPQKTILLTGVVLVFVEGFSMAAGSFLSESSVEEYEEGGVAPAQGSLMAAVTMFLSYFLAGFIPLFPYLLWPAAAALPASVAFSIAALVILGLISGRLTRAGMGKSAARMAVVGGLAIAVGAVAGGIVSQL